MVDAPLSQGVHLEFRRLVAAQDLIG